jgi:hypothetical protein
MDIDRIKAENEGIHMHRHRWLQKSEKRSWFYIKYFLSENNVGDSTYSTVLSFYDSYPASALQMRMVRSLTISHTVVTLLQLLKIRESNGHQMQPNRLNFMRGSCEIVISR